MIPLDELKAWLGVTGNADDDLLTQLERRVVAQVEASTGRYLGPEAAFVQILDGNGQERIWLREMPNDEPVIETRASLTEEWVPVAAGDLERDGRTVYLKAGLWPRGRRNVRVSYTAGYEAADVPQAEKAVVLELVARAYAGRGSETVQRERLGDLEVEYRPLKDIPDPLSTLSRRSVVR